MNVPEKEKWKRFCARLEVGENSNKGNYVRWKEGRRERAHIKRDKRN